MDSRARRRKGWCSSCRRIRAEAKRRRSSSRNFAGGTPASPKKATIGMILHICSALQIPTTNTRSMASVRIRLELRTSPLILSQLSLGHQTSAAWRAMGITAVRITVVNGPIGGACVNLVSRWRCCISRVLFFVHSPTWLRNMKFLSRRTPSYLTVSDSRIATSLIFIVGRSMDRARAPRKNKTSTLAGLKATALLSTLDMMESTSRRVASAALTVVNPIPSTTTSSM